MTGRRITGRHRRTGTASNNNNNKTIHLRALTWPEPKARALYKCLYNIKGKIYRACVSRVLTNETET